MKIKDELTLKQFLAMIIGCLLFLFVISPILENLVLQSRYKEMKGGSKKIETSDFDANITRFRSGTRDGFVELELLKKNSKFRFAELQIIDEDGYIIDKKYIDLAKQKENKKYPYELSYKGVDAVNLRIKGITDLEEKEKSKLKKSKLAKLYEKTKNTIINSTSKITEHGREAFLKLKNGQYGLVIQNKFNDIRKNGIPAVYIWLLAAVCYMMI